MNRALLLVVSVSVVLCVATFGGGQLHQLIQPGAAVGALLLPLLLAGTAYRGELPEALKAAWSTEPMGSGQALRQVEVLRSVRSLFVASGALTMVLGLVLMLVALHEPHKVGGGVAVTFLSVFYMVLVTELWLAPMIRQLAVRGFLPAEGGAASESSGAWVSLAVAFVLGMGGLVAADVIEGGHASRFLNITAFLMVSSGLLFAAGWHGPSALKAALGQTGKDASTSAEQLQASAQVLLSLRTAFYGMAGLGYLLANIRIMARLDDPGRLGAGFAVAMTVWLFALILAELVVGPRVRRLQAACALRGGVDERLARAAQTGPLPAILLVAGAVFAFVLVLYCLKYSP